MMMWAVIEVIHEGRKLKTARHEAGGCLVSVLQPYTSLHHQMDHGAHVDSKGPSLRCFHYVNQTDNQNHLFHSISYIR